MSKIKVIFDGFNTIEEAQRFADWYWHQGGSDSEMWFETCETGLRSVDADTDTICKNGSEFKPNEQGDIVVPLRLRYEKNNKDEGYDWGIGDGGGYQ